MNLEIIRFKPMEAPEFGSCKGCMFDLERFSVCARVAEIAKEKGLPDCEDCSHAGTNYIYVLDDSDPRQIPLIDNRGEVVCK
ncbi:MAG TPA: hypothetical protein VGC21_10195 [Telluria sp.]|jgi:hypothetical protein